MEPLKFVEEWYASQCDGDWEHQYGFSITTIDNPGWQVKVDLADTYMENLEIEYELIEVSEDDWFGFCVREKTYVAFGDPSKLAVILAKFQELAVSSKNER